MPEARCLECGWEGDWTECVTQEHGGYEEYWGTKVRKSEFQYFCPECGGEVEDPAYPRIVVNA